MKTRTLTRSLFALSAAATIGCGGGGDDGFAGGPVAIDFAASVGDEAFSCGRTFSGVGSTGATVEPTDLRFYVSDVRLVSSDGDEVPVALDQDGEWQLDDLALIDLEDGSGDCGGVGNAEMNSQVRGEVPAGDYTGLRFVLGVPFGMNHIDAATAPSPLNKTALFWNWQVGYKYIRYDNFVTESQQQFRVHLGSTACDGDQRGNVTACGNPNRVEVDLPGFNPEDDMVMANLGALFEGVDVTSNVPETQPGCQSNPMDPDCVGVFGNLGLPFGGNAGSGVQSLFTAESR